MERHHYNYILVERKVVALKVWGDNGKMNVPMLHRWAQWFESSKNRIVAQTHVGPFKVSTLFLGIDHCFRDDGPPIVFETMVFNEGDPQQMEFAGQVISYFPDVDSLMRRYCTIEEAEEGHAFAVKRLRAIIANVRKRVRIEARLMNLSRGKRAKNKKQ